MDLNVKVAGEGLPLVEATLVFDGTTAAFTDVTDIRITGPGAAHAGRIDWGCVAKGLQEHVNGLVASAGSATKPSPKPAKEVVARDRRTRTVRPDDAKILSVVAQVGRNATAVADYLGCTPQSASKWIKEALARADQTG